MAIIKSNVMGKFVGKVGTLSTYNNKTGNVARTRTNSTNVGEGASRTTTQQSNRTKWANLVNTYKISRGWMPKAFENKASNQSDYNKFMSVNYALSTVRLTKEEAAAGGCVIEPFYISQGSLPSIQVENASNAYVTNLRLGSINIDNSTTVAAFTSALLAYNKMLREGMQLSFVSYQQDVDTNGTPKVICTAYEVILSTTDERVLHDFLPYFCAESFGDEDEKRLGANIGSISIGCFAWILSETIKGKTYVSTQQLFNNNVEMIARYASSDQATTAMQSYGVNENVFLDSKLAIAQNASPQPIYITKVKNYSKIDITDTQDPTLEDLFDGFAASSAKCWLELSAPVSRVSSVMLDVRDSGLSPVSTAVLLSSDGTTVEINGAGWKSYYSQAEWENVNLRAIIIEADSIKYTFTFETSVHD